MRSVEDKMIFRSCELCGEEVWWSEHDPNPTHYRCAEAHAAGRREAWGEAGREILEEFHALVDVDANPTVDQVLRGFQGAIHTICIHRPKFGGATGKSTYAAGRRKALYDVDKWMCGQSKHHEKTDWAYKIMCDWLSYFRAQLDKDGDTP